MRAGQGSCEGPAGRLATTKRCAFSAAFSRARLDDGYALQSRCNFKMVWVRQTSAHSPWTLAKPRKRNWRNPRACLIWPKTGSTIVFRVARRALDVNARVSPAATLPASYPHTAFINAPGFVGRLKMTAQSLLQFGTVSLNP